MTRHKESTNKSCDTCNHCGNFTEMVAGRFMVYCEMSGGMVFQHHDGDCFVWSEKV